MLEPLCPVTVFAYILFGLGCLASLLGDIRFLVIAYRHSVLWLIACLLVPFAALVFFLLNAKETWKPVLLAIAGLIVAAVGYSIGGFHFSW